MRWLGVLGVCVLLAGCGPQAFACSSDDACLADGVAGTCEAIGFCSFPDDACPSGRRYGELAGGGLAGQCAPASDTDTDTSGQTGASASAEGSGVTTDPTVGPTVGSTVGPTGGVTTSAPETTTMRPETTGPTTTTGGGASTGPDASTSEDASTSGQPRPTCEDELLNGDETDVDCGGTCPGCDVGEMCGGDDDCASASCPDGVCTPPDVPDICDDGIQSGAEVGVDCGGTCAPCGVPCVGVHARWNPEDAQQNIEFDEDFRVATVTVDSVNDSVRADTALAPGQRYYWEVEVLQAATGWIRVGVADTTMWLEIGPGGDDGFGLAPSGSIQGVGISGLAIGAGDIVGVAVDVSLRRGWVHVNGTYGFDGGPTQSDGFEFIYDEMTTLYPMLTLGQGDALRGNFGNEAFAYTIPPGFVGGVCD